MTVMAGLRDHIGGVVFAAQPDLQHQRVGGMAREGEEHRRVGDLEKGDRRAVIDALALLPAWRHSSSSEISSPAMRMRS